MRTILITGSEGFVGSHLVKALKESLYRIESICYPLARPEKSNCIPLDIMNLEMTKDVISNCQPDIVFHLAAVSSVSKSIRDPAMTYNTNIIGTVNILEAIRGIDKEVDFFYVSTCEVYGDGENLAETADIRLNNPYAVSKYAGELICRDYATRNVDYIILRPFTHTGPGQAADFVLPTIARQIAEIEKSRRPPLVELGNIEVKREFINVQDIVRAYSLAIEKCKPGNIYNISSNKGYKIGDALKIFKRLSRAKFEVKIETSRVRKIDSPKLIGNSKKFNKQTKWKAKIVFKKTIEDLLNYWRAKV